MMHFSATVMFIIVVIWLYAASLKLETIRIKKLQIVKLDPVLVYIQVVEHQQVTSAADSSFCDVEVNKLILSP